MMGQSVEWRLRGSSAEKRPPALTGRPLGAASSRLQAREESSDMARIEGCGKVAPRESGKVTRRDRVKEPIKIQTDDPQTLVALIWRVIGDPVLVVTLIVLLAAATGMLFVLLTVVAPVWVHVAVAGSLSCGLLSVSIALKRFRHAR
jgi:hypothetical protein